MKNIALLLMLTMIFFACEETSSNTSTSSDDSGTLDKTETPASDNNTSTNPDESIDDQKAEKLGAPLEFASFNEIIAKAHQRAEKWTDSPLSVILEFTGTNVDSKIKNIRTKKLGPGEDIDDVLVTVEEDGLMDDSVSASLTMLRLKKENDLWQVYKATRAWKCWPGRGHQIYSGEPCK
ncbi:MAG: hypothetical protein AB8F74_22130 [Saprospiraceae bacterium]